MKVKMMYKYYRILLVSFLTVSSPNVGCSMQNEPFSFKELSEIPEFVIQKSSFFQATDGTPLAYYSFLPKNPSSLIIFYHGGGLYSNKSYQYIGMQLEKNFNIGSYFIDIRGHGFSGGARGDAPTVDQVLQDVTTVIQAVKDKYPTTAIYLVGHSSGAGLLLNYSGYEKRRDDLYTGYIFLSPYLGPRVGVERVGAHSFVKSVRVWIYILNQLLRVPSFQHIPAVFFDYPESIRKSDPRIVTSYSYTMSVATTPHNPALLFEQLDKPTYMFIGDQDEQFDAEKVIAFASYNKKGMVTAKIVPDGKHLSILVQAPELIARAI